MVFDHVVKFNEVYYPAGTDVPIEKEVNEAPVNGASKTVSAEAHKYTAEELNEMSVKAIKEIAEKNGITIKKISPKTEVIKEFIAKQH